jgi:hypothetical protein
VSGTSPRPVVTWALVASLVVYAVLAARGGWWLSAVAAPIAAVLLWRRHPRARFAAYVFFTAVAFRGAVSGSWALPAYAVAAVALMQTRDARRTWPRLVAGRRRGDDDRMRRS